MKVAATVCSMMFSLRVFSITQTFDPYNGGGSEHRPCYQQDVLILNLATVCPWPSHLRPSASLGASAQGAQGVCRAEVMRVIPS